MKHCNHCNRDLSKSRFHLRSASNDGLAARCKDCQSIYDAQRLHQPDRVALRLAYKLTDHGKKRLSDGGKAWLKRNPSKRNAHIALNNALRFRHVIKRPCVCGSDDVQAHHADYAKPLDVEWLCTQCHAKLHRAERAIERLRRINDPGEVIHNDQPDST